MSSVGLVLGGGGVTGAAFQSATLLAIRLATGWDPAEADVIVGTSGGAVTAAMVRGGGISTKFLNFRDRDEFTEELRSHLYRRARPDGLVRWARHGLLRGLRRPGVNFVLGSPARYHAGGIGEWVEERFGPFADWPPQPTVVAAYDLESGHRVAFGTEAAPDAPFPEAVAAASAVPLLYRPYPIDGRHYVDGGVVSGTNADLVLGSPRPLDLIVVIAPIGVSHQRRHHHFYEPFFDHAGRIALVDETETIAEHWPDCEILTLTPTETALARMRPNPLSPEAAIPTFAITMRSMKRELAEPHVWEVLERHLLQPAISSGTGDSD